MYHLHFQRHQTTIFKYFLTLSFWKKIGSILLCHMLLVPNSHADCTASGQYSNISIPDLNISPSLLVNSQIGIDYISTYVKQFDCGPQKPNGTFEGYGIGFQVNAAKITTINNRNIYESNIAGIGFAIGFSGGTQCSHNWFVWADQYTDSQGRRLVCSGVDMNLSDNTSGKFAIALYKTSEQTGSGLLDLSGRISSIVKNGPETVQANLNVPLVSNSPQISSTSCSVLNISPNPVSLPAVNINELKTINSVSKSTPFNINISCSGTANLYITFTDKNNIGETGSILSLDSSSTAHGIGLQLAHNGNVISYGPDASTISNTNQFFLNTFSGTQSFPFTASYIRTGPITPGNLSATATFTLSYQ